MLNVKQSKCHPADVVFVVLEEGEGRSSLIVVGESFMHMSMKQQQMVGICPKLEFLLFGIVELVDQVNLCCWGWKNLSPK